MFPAQAATARLSASNVCVAELTLNIQLPKRSFNAAICGFVRTRGCTQVTCKSLPAF